MKKMNCRVFFVSGMIVFGLLNCTESKTSGTLRKSAEAISEEADSEMVTREEAAEAQPSGRQEDFGLSGRTLLPSGRNPYFILEPGFQLVLEKEGNLFSQAEKLIVTVLDEIKEVDGVTTRVVEEREWKSGNLVEVSRNFFAICKNTNDVFYFGEEVDMYREGKVINHEGAWLAGNKGAKAGLIMPGKPVIGMKYYQEIARGVAMDWAEVIKVDHELATPAGTFTNCLLTREGTTLNPLEKEFKIYAPEIGLIQDEKLLLTKYGFVNE